MKVCAMNEKGRKRRDKCLYTYLDELTKTGVANVLKYIDELGGWPVLEGADWDSGNFSWEKALGQLLNKTGANSIIIETSINHDQKNSSYSVLEVNWTSPKYMERYE